MDKIENVFLSWHIVSSHLVASGPRVFHNNSKDKDGNMES